MGIMRRGYWFDHLDMAYTGYTVTFLLVGVNGF